MVLNSGTLEQSSTRPGKPKPTGLSCCVFLNVAEEVDHDFRFLHVCWSQTTSWVVSGEMNFQAVKCRGKMSCGGHGTI